MDAVGPLSASLRVQTLLASLAPRLGGADFASVMEGVFTAAKAGTLDPGDERLQALPKLSQLARQNALFVMASDDAGAFGLGFLGGDLLSAAFTLPEWARTLERVSDDPRVARAFDLWRQMEVVLRPRLGAGTGSAFGSLFG